MFCQIYYHQMNEEYGIPKDIIIDFIFVTNRISLRLNKTKFFAYEMEHLFKKAKS